MPSPVRNKSYNKQNKGGRPNSGGDTFRTLNEPITSLLVMKALQDKVNKLVDPEGEYKMTFEVLSGLTGNVVSKPYLSLIARGNHIKDKPTIKPRRVHAFAIDLIYATAVQTKGKQGELAKAMIELETELGQVLKLVRRVTRLRRIK